MLPKETAKDMGGIGPLVMVYKITKFIQVVDIHTMQTFEIDKEMYWKNSFIGLLTRERLSEFVVLDLEQIDTNMNDSRAALKQKFKQVRVQIARVTDFGHNDTTFWVNSHLGNLLDYNDHVMGYDLEHNNHVLIEEARTKCSWLPDIILVKKSFPKAQKKRKNRNWKLKHINKDEGAEETPEEPTDKKTKKKSKYNKNFERAQLDKEKDYEIFLQDIEEDPEYRAHINVYQAPKAKKAETDGKKEDDDWETDSEEEMVFIKDEEILVDNDEDQVQVHEEEEEKMQWLNVEEFN